MGERGSGADIFIKIVKNIPGRGPFSSKKKPEMV